MIKKTTVELTIDEVKEAIEQYVALHGEVKPVEVQVEVTKLNDFKCMVICDTNEQ